MHQDRLVHARGVPEAFAFFADAANPERSKPQTQTFFTVSRQIT